MKRVFCMLFVVSVVLSLVSCGVHMGVPSTINNNISNVVLQKNNYRIIQKVQGQRTATWVLGIGGAFRPLVEKARSEMLKDASLLGSAKAIINESVEVNEKFFLLFGFRTITVSAYVIEFIDGKNVSHQPTQQLVLQQEIQYRVAQPQQQYYYILPQGQVRSTQQQQNHPLYVIYNNVGSYFYYPY
ncbi:MAG: hypothetical protein LBC84_08960 [Prevotellaceae bacterium]|jgi:hypothetical protein|nr:hypothetical protein [Prevotellaceae bacterium]